MSNLTLDEQIIAVEAAFKHTEHLWRTVEGVACTAGLSELEVQAVFWILRSKMFRYPRLSKDNKELFALRSEFYRRAPWWQRFTQAMTGLYN